MIYVVGIGPGAVGYLTPLGRQLIDRCECLVGSPRHLDIFPEHHSKSRTLNKNLSELVIWLKNQINSDIVVLASGDPLLYGLGKYLCAELGFANLEIISGISAIQYLFSKVGLDMNEVYLTSSHGKQLDFDFMLLHDKVALVTDAKTGPYEIAQAIIVRGLSRHLIIGENLSYPNERIHRILPKNVRLYYELNAMIILKE